MAASSFSNIYQLFCCVAYSGGGGEIRAEIQSFLCPNSFFQEEQVR